MIIYILFIIFAGAFLGFTIVKGIKESNQQKIRSKEQDERLNLVFPGTILCKRISGNPFSKEPSIKVIDVKRNLEGEIWIKYAYGSIINPDTYFEKAPHYDKLKNILCLYPEIKTPDHL